MLLLSCQVLGADAVVPPLPAAPADFAVTNRCVLDIELAGKPVGRLTVALWGGAAPEAVAAFVGMCEGTQFLSAVDSSGRSTGAAVFGPWSWEGTSVERVDPGRQIIFAKPKLPKTISRKEAKLSFALPPPPPPSSTPPTPYRGAGYVRVRRSGADSVEFSISSGSGSGGGLFGGGSDGGAREWATIGQVEDRDGAALLLARLDGMPLNKYSSAPLRRVAVARAAAL
ncbi:hypothetical protein JKP88DRAFT_261693 [Tribonema minus]|uniref:PPIase cyclophilin-type domain-containing protein n=1 Tax=Tribonema minus TaxID=303371 RepID=A0A835YI03_9STRA|nr:hypothetical protein JKP88DRAFT_261693 [Tribonema minus]